MGAWLAVWVEEGVGDKAMCQVTVGTGWRRSQMLLNEIKAEGCPVRSSGVFVPSRGVRRCRWNGNDASV